PPRARALSGKALQTKKHSCCQRYVRRRPRGQTTAPPGWRKHTAIQFRSRGPGDKPGHNPDPTSPRGKMAQDPPRSAAPEPPTAEGPAGRAEAALGFPGVKRLPAANPGPKEGPRRWEPPCNRSPPPAPQRNRRKRDSRPARPATG